MMQLVITDLGGGNGTPLMPPTARVRDCGERGAAGLRGETMLGPKDPEAGFVAAYLRRHGMKCRERHHERTWLCLWGSRLDVAVVAVVAVKAVSPTIGRVRGGGPGGGGGGGGAAAAAGARAYCVVMGWPVGGAPMGSQKSYERSPHTSSSNGCLPVGLNTGW